MNATSQPLDVATHREQRIHELHREGIERVVTHLRLGHPNAAREFLFNSVEAQARLAGIIDVELPRRGDVA